MNEQSKNGRGNVALGKSWWDYAVMALKGAAVIGTGVVVYRSTGGFGKVHRQIKEDALEFDRELEKLIRTPVDHAPFRNVPEGLVLDPHLDVPRKNSMDNYFLKGEFTRENLFDPAIAKSWTEFNSTLFFRENAIREHLGESLVDLEEEYRKNPNMYCQPLTRAELERTLPSRLRQGRKLTNNEAGSGVFSKDQLSSHREKRAAEKNPPTPSNFQRKSEEALDFLHSCKRTASQVYSFISTVTELGERVRMAINSLRGFFFPSEVMDYESPYTRRGMIERGMLENEGYIPEVCYMENPSERRAMVYDPYNDPYGRPRHGRRPSNMRVIYDPELGVQRLEYQSRL